MNRAKKIRGKQIVWRSNGLTFGFIGRCIIADKKLLKERILNEMRKYRIFIKILELCHDLLYLILYFTDSI